MAKKPTVSMPRRRPTEAEMAAFEARTEARQTLAAGGRTKASKRSDVQTSDRRIVQRKGRILADGSRTKAPALIRLTVYLRPELGRALDVAAATSGRDRSSLIAEAVEQWLGGTKR